MNDAVRPDERAGWWRRTLALLVDYICIGIPSAIAGALLFGLSGGFIQWSNPMLQAQVCAPVTSLPTGLDPAPYPDSNQAQFCRLYSVVGQVGQVLTVSRITKKDNETTSVGRSYALTTSGRPGGYDLSWISWVAIAALLIGSESRGGTTPGKRLLGLRVMSTQDPEKRSIPLRQVVTRYGIAVGMVLIPIGIALAIVLLPIVLGHSPLPYAFLFFTLLLFVFAAGQFWNLLRIVRRRPTIYDEIACVEVVRVRPTARAASVTPAIPDQA